MAMDYVSVSEQIIDGVGDADNIVSATHCMTRLRLVLTDESRADDKAVEKIRGVKSVIRQGGQYQIVIGNEVSNLFAELKKHGNWSDGAAAAKTAAPKGNPIQRLFGFISGCMVPLLPAMLGCGMMKVVLIMLTTFAGMDSGGSTYILLNSFADCFFTFLPIFLGVTIAQKMGGSVMLFMCVGAALCYPDLISLMNGETLEMGTFLGMDCTYLFGIPVICASYTSSVLPMLLMAPVMGWAEKFADRVSPNVLKSFLKPLLFLIICIPCSLYVLGPIGNVCGSTLSNVLQAMYDTVPWLTIGVISAFMPFIVMTGMHHALLTVCFNNIATLGFDVLVIVTMYCSNLAQGGAALGVAFRTKDEETRSESIASGISAIFAGVTEPAMYGINLRFVKPMYAAVVGAGIGGLFCGITAVKGYAVGGSPSIMYLLTFIGGDDPMHSVIFGAIGAAIVLVISFVLTLFLFREPKEEEAGEDNPPAPDFVLSDDDHVISAPVPGRVIPLEEVPDAVFSSGAMGVGFGVIPSEGRVYAPFDGECQMVPESLHALGLMSDQGVELLIHVGLETVALEGKPFRVHVREGEPIRKGQLLMEFDIGAIRAAGCRLETPVLVSNPDDLPSIRVENDKILIGG